MYGRRKSEAVSHDIGSLATNRSDVGGVQQTKCSRRRRAYFETADSTPVRVGGQNVIPKPSLTLHGGHEALRALFDGERLSDRVLLWELDVHACNAVRKAQAQDHTEVVFE
jgi:hypothetical protein